MDEVMKSINELLTEYNLSTREAIEVLKMKHMQEISVSLYEIQEHLSTLAECVGFVNGVPIGFSVMQS